MATDPATLPGFIARFSAAGLVMGTGAADDGYVFGTGASFKDDSGTYTMSKLGFGFPQSTSRAGRRQLTQGLFSGGQIDGRYYNLSFPSVSTRQVGVVFIGKHSAGARGNNTPDASGTAFGQALLGVGNALGSTDNAFCCGLDTTGRMANFQDGILSPISGTRVGCGTTCLTWGSGASATYLKRMGFPAVAGAAFGALAKSGTSIRLLHLNTDTNGFRWAGSDWDEILVFGVDDATMATYAPTCEAWAASQYRAIAPSIGTIIVCGTSRGECCYGYGARSAAAFIQEALPGWDVINNCRKGYTLQNINTAAAALLYNANDFPLGTSRPIIHVIDEGSVNNINNGIDSAATIQAAYGTLCNTIKTNLPTSRILVLTDHAVGATAVKENKRLAVRDWLMGGGLAAYGATVVDTGNAVAAMNPATPISDASVAAVTGASTEYTLHTYAAPSLTTWDNVHYGIAGFDARKASVQAAARAFAGSVAKKLHIINPDGLAAA